MLIYVIFGSKEWGLNVYRVCFMVCVERVCRWGYVDEIFLGRCVLGIDLVWSGVIEIFGNSFVLIRKLFLLIMIFIKYV